MCNGVVLRFVYRRLTLPWYYFRFARNPATIRQRLLIEPHLRSANFRIGQRFLGPRGWARLLTDIPARHKVPAILVRLRFGHAAKETFCQTLLLK